ncbi:MAG: hypothetical protein ACREJU_12440, partial [Nitrospiraceae bacterium]
MEETFLYNMHFMPLLVVLAAFSTPTPAPRIAFMLAEADHQQWHQYRTIRESDCLRPRALH